MSRHRLSAAGPLVTALALAFSAVGLPVATAHGTFTVTIGCPAVTPDPTLPDAIFSANTNGRDDVVILTAGCQYDLVATLDIEADITPAHPHTITIIGNGATIDGGATVRVFDVQSQANLTLDRVNVANGQANIGGGILNSGRLTLTNSNVLFSTADDDGGGIYNGGTVHLTNSNVMHNSAFRNGGGIYTEGSLVTIGDFSDVSHNSTSGEGGGIFNDGGTVHVDFSRLTDNGAGGGGGAMSSDGTARFRTSTISDNQSAAGGGILNYGDLLLQRDSLLSDNHSSGDGGGIYSGGGIKIEDSSVSDNTAVLVGGGIANANAVVLEDSRLTDNRAARGGGVFNWGEFYPTGRPHLKLANSLLAHNLADAGGGGGIYNSGGVVDATSSKVSSNVAASDGGGIYNIDNVDGRKATVTFTSSALSDNSTTGTNVGTGGGGIDNLGEATFVTSTISRNHAPGGGGVLNYGALTLKSTTLSGNDAVIGGGLSNGSSATFKTSSVSNNTAEDKGGGIFNANHVVLDRSNVDDNRALLSNGGGIFNDGTVYPGGAALILKNSSLSTNRAEAGFGGAIFNIEGDVEMEGTINPTLPPKISRLSRNRARSGGGIYNTDAGTIELTRSAMSLNRATDLDGGGILNTRDGIVELDLSTVTANRADHSGGGIYNDNAGEVTIERTTLSQNVADGAVGGAIFNAEAEVDVSFSTLSGNLAHRGGAIFAGGQPLPSLITIFNSTLSDNTARQQGGGIFADSQSVFTVTWTTLMGNDNSPSGALDGGSLSNDSGTVTVDYSIVASSRGTHPSLPTTPSGSSCFGTILGGTNLTNTAPCAGGFVFGNPDLDTKLKVNGNPTLTRTHALSQDSDALDMGTACPPSDQRGPAGPRPPAPCDVGAFERP
jgi:fibronectin-binding autotransporter adhesin